MRVMDVAHTTFKIGLGVVLGALGTCVVLFLASLIMLMIWAALVR